MKFVRTVFKVITAEVFNEGVVEVLWWGKDIMRLFVISFLLS